MATLITDITTVLTALVGFIPTVLTAVMASDIFAFVIYASIGIAVIYFVVKLLKSFTGNKLAGGGRRRR